MRPSILFVTVFLILPPTAGVAKQPPKEEGLLPPPTHTPQLVISHKGPHARITALAFAPDGTLYVGGFSKLVHRYVLRDGKFISAGEPIRVPIGRGNAGAVNAVAVSPDGQWVAVAGRAPTRGEVWDGPDDGIVGETCSLSPDVKRDYGVVYLFNPANPQGGKVIRGQEAGVRALAFATPSPATGPVLVTAGVEWDRNGKKSGTIRVHDVTKEKKLPSLQMDLLSADARPGLAAWASGEKGTILQVAIAWPPDKGSGNLRVWDVGANQVKSFEDGEDNFALALRAGNDGAAREMISGGYWEKSKSGQLVIRPTNSIADAKPFPLSGDKGYSFSPLAVSPVGKTTAVLLQIDPRPPNTMGLPTELRLVAADGRALDSVLLKGVDPNSLPVLAASPDGRFLVVGGFADHRVEVYDVKSLKKRMNPLDGAPAGFERVVFLAGNRLGLGGTGKPDVVLDLKGRNATQGGRTDVDGPPQGGLLNRQDWGQTANEVKIKLKEYERPFSLLEGQQATAVAVLPAGPSWDKALAAVVAVAHYDAESAVPLVTLFNAKGEQLLQLNGPSLTIRGLAFSGSRPLLAAVGDDRVISVWSLKNLAEPFAAIEGLRMVERDGVLAVSSVDAKKLIDKPLAPRDIVLAVGDENGKMTPVKTYREFLQAVREIPIGKTARLQIQGKPPVIVPVGRGVGGRHPLFDVWVNPDPTANKSHDWIGWCPAGPYDTNSLDAEARLGWLTATGNPARPVVYAGADQYRRLYYKPNFLGLLAEEGDFGGAWKRYIAASPPPTPPTLAIHTTGSEERDGLILQRTAPDGIDVRLHDPGQVLTLDAASIRWRSIDRDGKTSGWNDLPFRSVPTKIELPRYDWSRGSHRFEVALHEAPALPAVATTAITLHSVPPAPTLTFEVDGKPVADGQEPMVVAKEAVEITAKVLEAPGEEVIVTLTTGVAEGNKPVEQTLEKKKDGQFGPVTVKLPPDSKTMLRVTAKNRRGAAGNTARYEATSADVTVWRTTPKVRLSVTSTVDSPSAPDQPYVSDTPQVSLSAAIAAENYEKLEWDDGDGQWVDSAFKPANPKAATASRNVTIAVGGKPQTLKVRVTAGGVTRTDTVDVVWAPLPKADFVDLPAKVRDSNPIVTGTVRPTPGGVPFKVQVFDSTDPLRPRREFDSPREKLEKWSCPVQLSPGTNVLRLVVKNDWKEKTQIREIDYIRPPLVVSAKLIAAPGANLGDVVAVVVAPVSLPPLGLTLGKSRFDAKTVHGPSWVCGLPLWWLKAESVPLEDPGTPPGSVRVGSYDRDGDGPTIVVKSGVEVLVVPPQPKPPPPPPKIDITTDSGIAISNGKTLGPTNQSRFRFRLKVTSAVKLDQINLRWTDSKGTQRDQTWKVSEPAGFVRELNHEVELLEGVNRFDVMEAPRSEVKFSFTISYTPPASPVQIQWVKEAGVELQRGANGEYEAKGGVVRVSGTVDLAGLGKNPNKAHSQVVLIANEVRHLPVEIKESPGVAGFAFEAPLFLNAEQVNVRIEIWRQGGIQPEQTAADTRFLVRSKGPLVQQRLHLLVIAPQAKEAERKVLARTVITAIGGTYPPKDSVRCMGGFAHPSFAKATLYPLLIEEVEGPQIESKLRDITREIQNASGEPTGEPKWVNDVVLVYYQGRDEIQDGGLCLHTTTSETKRVPPLKVTELPPTPGVRLLVLNVVKSDGPVLQPDPIRSDALVLRYVWQDAKGAEGLPKLYQDAVGKKPKVGEVVDWVGGEAKKTALFVPLTDKLPDPVRERLLGVVKKHGVPDGPNQSPLPGRDRPDEGGKQP